MNPVPLGVYRHYKGNQFEVVGFAKHSEILEEQALEYQNLFSKGRGLLVQYFSETELIILDDFFANECRYSERYACTVGGI